MQRFQYENDILSKQLKKSHDKCQELNSRILILEQVASPANPAQFDAREVQLLKQQINRQQGIIDVKENYFIELYSLILQRIPKTDKVFYTKI